MKLTNQQKAEAELNQIKSTFQANQELSRSLFEHMPIGMCITNEHSLFTDVNATYCDIYGYTREELIGKHFTMVVPKEHQQQLEQLHREFLDKKYELQGRWTVQDKGGNQFDIITNAAYLFDENLNERRKMTLVVKASELENTLERLKTTIDILEQKIATQDAAHRLAEHDMRNRLSSIVSIADILTKSQLDEQQGKWVRMIKNIGNDTLRLLTAAKDYSKMERGEYKPELSKFDLVSLIVEETTDFKELIEEKNCTVTFMVDEKEIDPSDTKLDIEADKFYLSHLFQNLIRNALEAAPNESTVTITVTVQNFLKISIHNQGMIPEKIQGQFFEKYTTSGKERGTGLGTYIAKLIAEVHGGTISFVTSKVDGTTLHVQFPHALK